MNANFITEHAEDFYLSYPTNNGFCSDGDIILGRISCGRASLWRRNIATSDTAQILDLPIAEDVGKTGFLIYAVAQTSDTVIYRSDQKLWCLDPNGSGSPECIFTAEVSQRLEGLHSVTSDGEFVYAVIRPSEEQWKMIQISCRSGEVEGVLEKSWCIGHPQVSPFDDEWLGFCHDNKIDIPDRVWGWSRGHASGFCLSDQRHLPDTDLTYFCHEKWRRDKLGAIVVAYGTSPAGIPGLYEVFTDGRTPNLISRGETFWHSNISDDGRWAVCDTKLPKNGSGVSSVTLLDMESGVQRVVAEARSKVASQLTHPHPRFTADGNYILFQDADPSDELRSRVGIVDVRTDL